MTANIFIKSVELRPNPVKTGEAFTVAVGIGNRVSALADNDGSLIVDAYGASLWVPEGNLVLTDADGALLTDADGITIETEE